MSNTMPLNRTSGMPGHTLPVDPRSLRLWNLLNQASEIMDDIGSTLHSRRLAAREAARAHADATTADSLRRGELVRQMHTVANAPAAVLNQARQPV